MRSLSLNSLVSGVVKMLYWWILEGGHWFNPMSNQNFSFPTGHGRYDIHVRNFHADLKCYYVIVLFLDKNLVPPQIFYFYFYFNK